jgi:hypothetical protein
MSKDPELNIVPNGPPPFTFLHASLGLGKVTCAIRWCPEDPSVVEVGLSFCSPKDQFIKKRGREIATARIIKQDRKNHFSFVPNPDERLKCQILDMLSLGAETVEPLRTAYFPTVVFPGWASR